MSDGSNGVDRSVVAAAMRGQADALQEVWEDHRRWVAGVLLAHKPREADLEDLLQEVAMTLVRTIGKLRDGAMLRPWLRTVAINAARASGRSTGVRRRAVETWKQDHQAGLEAAQAAPAPPRTLADRQEGGRLIELARTLPEGYREPLLLRCVRGMSYREIGELMGLPETTIETRIARGRRMLRELADEPALAGQRKQEGSP